MGPSRTKHTASAGPERVLRTGRGAMLYDASRIDQPDERLFEREYWRLHVSLFDPRTGKKPHALPKAAGRQLLALFQEHRVTHVFAGHIHGYFSEQWGGVPFTITGGAGVPFHGQDPNHYFHHYVKVSLTPEGLKTQVARLAAE